MRGVLQFPLFPVWPVKSAGGSSQLSILFRHMLAVWEPPHGDRQVLPIAPYSSHPHRLPLSCVPVWGCLSLLPLQWEGIYILIGRPVHCLWIRQTAGHAPSYTSFQWTFLTISEPWKIIFLAIGLYLSHIAINAKIFYIQIAYKIKLVWNKMWQRCHLTSGELMLSLTCEAQSDRKAKWQSGGRLRGDKGPEAGLCDHRAWLFHHSYH